MKCRRISNAVELTNAPLFSFHPLNRVAFFHSIGQHVEPPLVAQKVIQGVYPGVTTVELDE